MFKINQINLETFVSHPVQTGLFVSDLAILMFLPIVRPPVVLSILLVGGLVYLSMYFGALFAAGTRQHTGSA